MRNSLLVISLFVLGVLVGHFGLPWFETIGAGAGDRLIQAVEILADSSGWVLMALMFLVGITIGSDGAMQNQLRRLNPKVLLLPVATIAGTLVGALAVGCFIKGMTPAECMMVGSGLGYYSLSSVLITQSHGAALGTLALIANVLRELATLLLAPFIVRWFGPLALISSGGATTADTTLPVIARFSGKDFIFVAMLHGVIVDVSVPFLVTLFSKL